VSNLALSFIDFHTRVPFDVPVYIFYFQSFFTAMQLFPSCQRFLQVFITGILISYFIQTLNRTYVWTNKERFFR